MHDCPALRQEVRYRHWWQLWSWCDDLPQWCALHRPWGGVAMYALEGGNIGLQLGGQATDFVLLVMNPRGAESLMGSRVKLGADAAAAAGPKGRTATAATDVVMRAEIGRASCRERVWI